MPDAFFDTNVLLYLLSDEPKKANRAEALLAAGGVISVQVLNEFASVGARKLGLRVAEIREILAAVRAVCTILPVDIDMHDRALDLAEQYRFSIYDALIVAGASSAGCKILFTEDLQHGQKIDGLLVQDPFR